MNTLYLIGGKPYQTQSINFMANILCNLQCSDGSAWKCNFPPFDDIMTDQSTDQQTDKRGQMDVTIPISESISTNEH